MSAPGSSSTPPHVGDILKNNEIAKMFDVGIMGGMRRSTKRNLLVLISDPFKGLYKDRWEGDVLHYTGMGPTGDQSLGYAQNRTLAESTKTKIPLHLLEALASQRYTYVGQVELTSPPYQEKQIGEDKGVRSVWMFPVRIVGQAKVPEPTIEQTFALEEHSAAIARTLSLDQLKTLAASRPSAMGRS